MKFRSGKDARNSMGLTIFQNGFAAVREMRSFGADNAIDQVTIEDLPDQIEADSVHIKGISVLEQTFSSGRPSKEQLLKSCIGHWITVKNMEFGEETIIRLLAAEPDLIGEKEGTGEIVINPTGDLVLPPAEPELVAQPTISCHIEPGNAPAHFELFYLAAGIQWQAHYTAELRNGEILLVGWMTIENRAGMDFENCNLTAVAGTVKRAEEPFAAMKNELFRSNALDGDGAESGSSEAVVYNISRPFTISSGDTKQLKFLDAQPIGFQRIYRIEGRSENAAVFLQFGGADSLETTLPAGVVKFYERNERGGLEFIGEDRIRNTPAKGKVVVKIGEAFNLTNKARERSRKKIDGFEYVTFQYQISNSKTENAGVLVDHMVTDSYWEMESSSHDYEVMDSHTLEFHVRIGAGKTVELEFTYKTESSLKKLID